MATRKPGCDVSANPRVSAFLGTRHDFCYPNRAMDTPKGWTSYTGGVFSVELPARKSAKRKINFRRTTLQKFLEAHAARYLKSQSAAKKAP